MKKILSFTIICVALICFSSSEIFGAKYALISIAKIVKVMEYSHIAPEPEYLCAANMIKEKDGTPLEVKVNTNFIHADLLCYFFLHTVGEKVGLSFPGIHPHQSLVIIDSSITHSSVRTHRVIHDRKPYFDEIDMNQNQFAAGPVRVAQIDQILMIPRGNPDAKPLCKFDVADDTYSYSISANIYAHKERNFCFALIDFFDSGKKFSFASARPPYRDISHIGFRIDRLLLKKLEETVPKVTSEMMEIQPDIQQAVPEATGLMDRIKDLFRGEKKQIEPGELMEDMACVRAQQEYETIIEDCPSCTDEINIACEKRNKLCGIDELCPR